MSQEELNNEVQIRLAVHDEKFNSLMTKIDATNQRVDDFISEMRQQNEMLAQENAEIRQSIKEIYQTTDSKISDIRNSIQAMQNQNVVLIIGVIAIAVAVFLK